MLPGAAWQPPHLALHDALHVGGPAELGGDQRDGGVGQAAGHLHPLHPLPQGGLYEVHQRLELLLRRLRLPGGEGEQRKMLNTSQAEEPITSRQQQQQQQQQQANMGRMPNGWPHQQAQASFNGMQPQQDFNNINIQDLFGGAEWNAMIMDPGFRQ